MFCRVLKALRMKMKKKEEFGSFLGRLKKSNDVSETKRRPVGKYGDKSAARF
jgi:hypothetical protein